jgi:lipoprotein NlpI
LKSRLIQEQFESNTGPRGQGREQLIMSLIRRIETSHVPAPGTWMRACLLAAVLAGTWCGAAEAQTLAQQWAWCHDDESDRLIRACTAVIRSGRESPENLAKAFFNRGRAYSDKGLYDLALSDFDRAIRLDPDFADAFNGRGIAYVGKGQYAQAIGEFDQAIRLDPNYAIAIYNRGLALQNLGRMSEAAQEFARAKETGPRLTLPKE